MESLRRVARGEVNSEVISINACDPLNLVGIILPGLRIPGLLANQIAFLHGEAVGFRLGDDIKIVKDLSPGLETRVRTALLKKKPVTMPSRGRLRTRSVVTP